ncbi:hypothetical protein RBG61_03335 [Paludicola sp. MB14-C6]|uniref:hypothetical protein n=1 Tax=Paludihabitans sp. MB14-C6 TaxID=3070656 RepID=UPI0027DC739E|nr:hypothetical protein [Paludicola sp. MB14-C6]WMJ23714.1 hypothetical protein RBG61_03335 [Paludicola sp. MB14-C6]
MSRTIEIIKGEEFKIKQTEVNANDFFFPVYEQARDRLIEIVNASLPQNISSNSSSNDKKEDFLNNIIAFCGERGQGKSSAMQTFSKVLKEYSTNLTSESVNNLFTPDKKPNAKFHVLDSIDPTRLESQDNILKIIVSRIFAEFKKYWKAAEREKSSIADKNEILTLFQKCYKHIITIKNPSLPKCEDISFEDSLEDLARLGDSSNFKKDLQKLIETFFKIYFSENGYKNYMLVIQVDDTDLNVKKAYEIVEDIRKYFMIPNVIILMATKIDQLTKAVEQQYRVDFKTLIDNDRIQKYELQQMASKYIDKLIPDGRKIYLPEISAVADSSEEQVVLKYLDSKESKVNLLGDNHDINFQDTILKYIYKKTGVIFVRPDQGVHQIIPKTMRELVNFLSILGKMEDIKDQTSTKEFIGTDGNVTTENIIIIDKETRLKNISTFEEFLINTWVRNNVDDGYNKFIDNVIATPNINKHRQVITDFYDVIEKSDVYSLKKCSKENEDGYQNYLSGIAQEKKSYVRDNALLYSISDVIDTLKNIESYYPIDSVKKYTFAIKTIYTITMHKIILSLINKDNDKENEKYSLVDEFIGGDIFGNSIADSMIRKENGDKSRTHFDRLKDTYYSYCSTNGLNKTTQPFKDFIYKGFTSPDFDYYIYDEKNRFSQITFNVSVYFIKKIRSDISFGLFILNMDVIQAIIDYKQKYKSPKEASYFSDHISYFYEKTSEWISKYFKLENSNTYSLLVNAKTIIEEADTHIDKYSSYFNALFECSKDKTESIKKLNDIKRILKIRRNYTYGRRSNNTLADDVKYFLALVNDIDEKIFEYNDNCIHMLEQALTELKENDFNSIKAIKDKVVACMDAFILSLKMKDTPSSDNDNGVE